MPWTTASHGIAFAHRSSHSSGRFKIFDTAWPKPSPFSPVQLGLSVCNAFNWVSAGWSGRRYRSGVVTWLSLGVFSRRRHGRTERRRAHPADFRPVRRCPPASRFETPAANKSYNHCMIKPGQPGKTVNVYIDGYNFYYSINKPALRIRVVQFLETC